MELGSRNPTLEPHTMPAVDPPDSIRTPIQPEVPALTHPLVESTPVLDQHVHLHDCTPCLGSPAPGCLVSGPAKSPLPVPETPAIPNTSRAICPSIPTDSSILSGVIGTCGVGLHTPHAGTPRDVPISPPDPTIIRTPTQPQAWMCTQLESTPVLDQHAHLHVVKPCRVSIPSTVRGYCKNKKYFYSRSTSVSNLKSPFH